MYIWRIRTFLLIPRLLLDFTISCLIPSIACRFVRECSKGAESASATINDMHKMPQRIIWVASIFIFEVLKETTLDLVTIS